MPYTISKRGNQYCVIKRDDGKSMGCHDTRSGAARQIAAIEANENKAAFDKSYQQVMDDLARDTIRLAKRYTEKKKRQQLWLENNCKVYKDADGTRHMLIITSNSYKDREDEFVSTEALQGYVDSQWKDDQWAGDNDLLFWHDGPAIGEIIHADMEGPFLYEVARERKSDFGYIQHYTKSIWDYVENNPDVKWGASHGFGFEPQDKEYTDDGAIYHRIRKFETSILPVEYAANAYTVSGVIDMSDRKEQLEKILPGWGEGLRSLLNRGKTELDKAGIEHKALGAKVTKQDLVDVMMLANVNMLEATKDGEEVNMKDALSESLDALMEVPTVNLTDVEALLEVEDDEPEAGEADDIEADETAEHDHTEAEPTPLEKALTNLVDYNDQMMTDQKAIVEAMPKLEKLTKALEGLDRFADELDALKGTVEGLQDEFKQRPRSSRSKQTEVDKDNPVAKEVTKEPVQTYFGYDGKDE